MTSLDYTQYSQLYARYVRPKRTQVLLNGCGPFRGLRVLDLCGGGGRVSLEAIERGAEQVLLVDASPQMVQHLANTPKLSLLVAPLETVLPDLLPGGPFDVVVCQQAINLWFCPELIGRVRAQMREGGVFVFDTFWQQPCPVPVAKEYDLGGRRYQELMWSCGEHVVEHVQVCEGMASHSMRFKWVSPAQFRAALEPHFVVEEYREGRASIYRCTAR